MKNQNSVKKPRLPREFKSLNIEVLHDDDGFSDFITEHGTISGNANRISIERAKLCGVRFECSLHAAEFEDVAFENCDLSNVDLSDAILLRVSFKNCRMTGVNFSGATFKDMSFENDMLNYANFHFARFEKAGFSECNCKEADFAEVDFSKVEFSDTMLQKAQMSGTALSGIDFTSCDIDGLGVRPEDLRGSVFTMEQAVTAAQVLGIIIR